MIQSRARSCGCCRVTSELADVVRGKCVLTSKQIVVIVGVNSVGLGRCAAGRLLADAVGLRNSPAHRHGVTLQTTTTETSCHYSLQPVRTGADKQGGVM